MSVNGTLVEAKMWTFTLESTNFIFKKCPIYTHDGAGAKFSTNPHEMDYSVGLRQKFGVAIFPTLIVDFSRKLFGKIIRKLQKFSL